MLRAQFANVHKLATARETGLRLGNLFRYVKQTNLLTVKQLYEIGPWL